MEAQENQKEEQQQVPSQPQEQQQPPRPQSSPSQSYHSSRSSSPEGSKSSHSRQADGEPMHDDQNKEDKEEGEPERKIRYKYCCKVCKHTDVSKKACVCVVPKSQRRTEIGEQGCQTCNCKGCSKEDFISRGEDPEYHPGDKYKNKKKEKQQIDFEARNGCCRKCMKAFSKNNRSCLCQVPEDVRNGRLPTGGCKICGCSGCNPEDKKEVPKPRKSPEASRNSSRRERSRSRQKRKRNRSYSEKSESKEQMDPASMNFYNVDKSMLGSMLVNDLRVDPSLVGFGIPQRSYSYILGKPK